MWYDALVRMPYVGDPDYRDSLIDSIKKTLGEEVVIDVTLFANYGYVSVDTTLEGARMLAQLPLLGSVREGFADRGIIPDSSRTFI